ncbi:hypothetical protein [Methyloceanibacter caenitepidi]|uniref:Uncharacterized protein n=1 Tax=Methyloceanibacter caenitepidi TaxID=1384459 RepID=A0A0A8K0S2_9HYPH|nr:hypothetical protein [Methyloceanibacter caenitepidi]BAQ16107.1 hypothetical protein GL4_0644 [Methyloceanibacter caenitepidi]
MCTGIELAALASLATTVVGSGVSAYGAHRAGQERDANAAREAAARNAELEDVLRRNRKIADESRDLYTKREEAIAPKNTKRAQEEATQDRTNILTDAISGPEEVPISGSAPEVVKTDLAKRLGEAVSGAKEEAKALGKVGSYGDFWFNQGLADTELGRGIETRSNFQQGNLNLLPYSSDLAAFQTYKPSTGIGEAMMAAGPALGQAGEAYYGAVTRPKTQKKYQSPFMGT